jgi:hypothetical protein
LTGAGTLQLRATSTLSQCFHHGESPGYVEGRIEVVLYALTAARAAFAQMSNRVRLPTVVLSTRPNR